MSASATNLTTGTKRGRSRSPPKGTRASRSGSVSSSASSQSEGQHGGAAKRTRGSATDPAPVAAFLFRRDFRLHDNTALLAVCAKAAAAKVPVLPLFFFNPTQCDKQRNPYFGEASFQFLCESLVDLDGPAQLDGRLVCLRGSDESCLQYVQRKGLRVTMLGYNEDFTPYAAVRDERLETWCAAHDVATVSSNSDYTLLPLDTVTNGSDQPYSVFTAFYKRLLADHVKRIPKVNQEPLVVAKTFLNGGKGMLSGRRLVDPGAAFTPVPRLLLHGGRQQGLTLLSRVPSMKHYTDERDDIAGDKTSHLAPHLKFGTVSIREAWETAVKALGLSHGFPRQLIWREFYAMLIATHPQLVGAQLKAFPDYKPDTAPASTPDKKSKDGPKSRTRGATVPVNQPFMAKYLHYKWKWDEAEFTRFKHGQTGVPLVDAAVRCLTTTGWCHNRTRMLIANFLVKTLGVDWREGERWFATVGVDFDVANNNGGWLWSSGQGADAQPYFRTFSAFRQAARFDSECAFIYAWVPELRNVPPAIIHTWDEYCAKQKHVPCEATEERRTKGAEVVAEKGKRGVTLYRTCYPAPMVDIKARTKAIIEEFKKYDPPKK